MRYFENNRNVTFEDLSRVVDKDGKRIYPDNILQKLATGDYNCLNQLTKEARENVGFMEPLLYAVKNEKGTYMVYKYYGEELQEDLGLLIEVVLEDPKIIENTPISYNREFMLDIAEIKPSVIPYIADSLKSDPEFKEELHELQDKGVNFGLKLEENPELRNNAEFMQEAIKEDAHFLQYASEELKNNYEFMKSITRENYKTVEHVIKNREDFGLEGIRGAKETTRELTVEDYMAILDDMSDSSDDDRYNRVRQKVAEKGSKDPKVVRWITAMAAQSDRISGDNFQKVLDNAILTMIKTQKDLTEDGEIKVSVDNMQEFITPHILNKLKDKAIEQGLEIDSDLEVKIEEYTKFFNNYREKLQEQKRANRNKATEEKVEQEKDDIKVEPQDIERVSAGVRTSEINQATTEIREEYTLETKEEKEVESDDRGTSDEERS